MREFNSSIYHLAAILRTAIYHRSFIAVCLGAAVIIRIAWIFLINPQPVSDFH
jgi:hypothetical protein